MNEYKCCRYCSLGTYIPVMKKTMCKNQGIVARDFICPKFSFDPFRIKVNRERNLDFSKYDKEDFSIE